MMPDLPDPMAAAIEDYFPNDNIFAISSNLDAALQSLGPSGPAATPDLEIMVISPPNSPPTHLPNSASTDEQYSPDSSSTIEASDSDLTVEAPPTAGVQFLANNSDEVQHEPPPADSFPVDVSPLLSRSNQFKHRAETTSSVNSRQHRRKNFVSRPTAIIRPRINTRPRFG